MILDDFDEMYKGFDTPSEDREGHDEARRGFYKFLPGAKEERL